ncbi:MAG TPA: ABC transporter substrate-binding protein [Candidatus Cybelea sp.]|nr:ABC transporter substrate-binding protein [Candidatus Cybelea sp.]
MTPDISKELAPSGRLRAAINFGNPVLAQKDPANGEPRGVSAELARELARRLGVPVAFVTFVGAGQVFEALKSDAWDVAFLAIDPVRAAGIDFTAPYVVIEGTYVVPAESRLQTIEDIDQDGVRIAVGGGSAYDLFLTRELKHARIVRAATSAAAIDMFVADNLEAVAGVRQPLARFTAGRSDVRMIPGRFMTINQAVATPKGRAAGARYLREFVETMKASGFVARALAASGQTEASIAPPSPVD